jgi:hypothetical protein
MDQRLHVEITVRLQRDYGFKQENGYLRKGECPRCAKKEYYTHAEHPWVLRCGRLEKCGFEEHVKEVYADLFESWSDRYPQQPAAPNAAADAYLRECRGFDLAKIEGWYSQEHYWNPEQQLGSATVRFALPGIGYWERLIDRPQRFGLAGTRMAFKFNAFYYRHRDTGKWERISTDLVEAKRRAALYNNPGDSFGTIGYCLDLFLVDVAGLVKSGQRSQRTLDDYLQDAVVLKAVFGRTLPEQLKPSHVSAYLDEGARLNRAVRANREKACLSSMIGWLIRNNKTTLSVNPCLRGSGTQRNLKHRANAM